LKSLKGNVLMKFWRTKPSSVFTTIICDWNYVHYLFQYDFLSEKK